MSREFFTLPSPRFGLWISGAETSRRLLLMLQGFIDDSGWDGRSPVFVLAGYIAPEKRWKAFSKAWQKVLDIPEPNPIPHLKGVEAYLLQNRNSPFYGWTPQQRDDRLTKFIDVINGHVTNAIVSVVPIEPYRRLFEGKFSTLALDRPYFFSFFGIIVRLVRIAKGLGETGPIDLIFDTQGGESKALLVGQYNRFLEVTPGSFVYSVHRFPNLGMSRISIPYRLLICWLGISDATILKNTLKIKTRLKSPQIFI